MSGYRLPAPQGAWIDRSRPLHFQFNGREVQGYAGDTVASALLAQGIVHVGRSFKLHRPRGIFSCGVEEPTGLLDVGLGAHRTPNTRATDIAAQAGLQAFTGNAWPSLGFDLAAMNSRLAAFLPAGFYYKTFMWPHWHLFEPTIRRLAGLGTAADAPDPDRYDEVSVSAEVLVVGGGAAGLQAALSAARAGRQVLLLEGDPYLGGWLGTQDDARLAPLIDRVVQAGVQVQVRTTAVGLYDHRLVTAVQSLETADGPGPVRERLWKIRARQIILATGAFERPMLFPDNDRPGVMLAGAVARYASHYGVACGRRVVVAAASDHAYGVAASLHAAGIEVAAIVDRRDAADINGEAPAGVEVLPGSAIVAVSGRRAVQGVRIGGAVQRDLAADLIASHAGFTPNVNLYSQAGGSLRWLTESAMFVPRTHLAGVAVVGACAGLFTLDSALAQAERVGQLTPGAVQPGFEPDGAGRVPADTRAEPGWLPPTHGKVFVDLQNDVAASDVELAARENYRSVEHFKRYTTNGMATDQGKTSNVNGLVILGASTGREPQDVGTTKFRPPYKPVTLGALVGGRTGPRYRPLKPLAARDWHLRRGALFEEFGGWERPAAYPQAGEDLVTAAEREAAQVRAGVGLFDGSPLGKIELYGPDAADFLDLMYVGTMSTLPVGGARYGALLNENGIVVDDGIVARLGPQHFWVNTTSGGVDAVALGFEEWLQCEYVNHRVMVMPLTAQWGNVTVSGPNAWQLLARAGFDEALAPGVMKHMTLRESTWRGHAVRVLRASFNGELGYEINLPPSQCEALLDQLWEISQGQGQDLGVCAYGVEALMIMRTEKGFLHVGADTDGTTLPQDVGLARGVAKKAANFVGRRSMSRPAGQDPERLQLVGLQPVDRRTRLPVGAHLSPRPPPTQAEGFVTSSCYSPALQQPIALAMVRRGKQRLGERLTAWHLGAAIEAEIVKTPFYDAAGERLRA
jgi:sarcosine oxidase subunit alpha